MAGWWKQLLMVFAILTISISTGWATCSLTTATWRRTFFSRGTRLPGPIISHMGGIMGGVWKDGEGAGRALIITPTPSISFIRLGAGRRLVWRATGIFNSHPITATGFLPWTGLLAEFISCR